MRKWNAAETDTKRLHEAVVFLVRLKSIYVDNTGKF